MKKIWMNFSRILIGVVFVFSSFVKGVDPLGTAYKLEDYFAAFGTAWANDYSLIFSIVLCTLEFMIGIALLLNLRMNFTAWALLLMMVFFTGLTLNDAIFNPVPDCGCFGDAITLSNWETFYKNVVLMLFVFIVFRRRKEFNSCWKFVIQNVLLVLLTFIFIGFSYYNYTQLPLIDFRPWKVGNNMSGDKNAEVKVYLRYRNVETGEEKEYLSPDYPWNDPEWMDRWEFVDQRFESDKAQIAHNLLAEDESGNDFTSYILESEEMFVFVSYDIKKASKNSLIKISEIGKMLEESGYKVVLLTSCLPEEVKIYQKDYDVGFETFYADEVVLKTIIRSNPGLVLFHKGFVASKWHFNSLPHLDEVQSLVSELDEKYSIENP